MNELQNELNYITLEISYAEDFADATLKEYEEIEDSLDDISDSIFDAEAKLAMIEKDFASWEAYKEKLARELSVLEDELTVYQKKADKFYALVNSELDNTEETDTVTEE